MSQFIILLVLGDEPSLVEGFLLGSTAVLPSSRILLIGEQPNAWDLLQPRARMSRHRGADPGRR